jgi:unsaturated chondroitin disaccharide hydrolase
MNIRTPVIHKELIEWVFTFAGEQLKRLVNDHPDAFPMFTQNGKWVFEGEKWTNWCEGFLGGELWLLYQHTGDPFWHDKAIHYSELIEPRKLDRGVHDLGFLFWPTWKRWFDIDKNQASNRVVIQAGRTLAMRFQEHGRYLCSFLGPESLFIDIMMNIGLVFYAAQQEADGTLAQIALEHCLTTRRYLVRGDGSTTHEGIFNLQTGEFLRQSTQQGWRSDSCWARGQAWAIYGFASAYSWSRDIRFLHTAQSCADFFLRSVPEHGVPPNDFDDPAPALPYESSAAAIAARGLLLLAEHSESAQESQRYRESAIRILNTLCTPEFLASATPGWEGILKHGIYHQKMGVGVDESVIWGDYFFLEALYEVLHG